MLRALAPPLRRRQAQLTTMDARTHTPPVKAARSLADFGLICGFAFREAELPQPLEPADMQAALEIPGNVVWLHFNASHAGVRRWLAESSNVPAVARTVLEDREMRHRLENVEDGLLVVINDLMYNDAVDPGEVATLWAYVTPRSLITARFHPLRGTDLLRSEVRAGLRVGSGIELLGRLLDLQVESIEELIGRLNDDLDHAEDEVLRDQVGGQREALNRIRRLCVHLRRHFRPQRAAIQKLATRPPAWLADSEPERLRGIADDLGYAIDEAEHQQERAKILLEELASREAESTGRNLYVLTIYTVVFMPMTLISGIFGMNVAGLPGIEGAGSFWWVMALIVAAGAATLGALLYRQRR
jgi:zinc transporter